MTTQLTQRDYRRIERALHYLHTQRASQPSLAQAAASVHLSEAHFQRLFTRWAGVSPKRFLQFLNKEYLKNALARHDSLMAASLETGLSSSSRAHELFVNIEAMTPAQYRRHGRGLHIDYGFHPSPFGECLIGVSPLGLCHLAFTTDTQEAQLASLRAQWPDARLQAAPTITEPIHRRLFSHGEDNTPLPVLLRGTNFQLKVWEALLTLPPGQVCSYEGLAEYCDRPAATRAVASAVARNRLAWLIPCHRVIRKLGTSGEYRWGSERKALMLAWEAVEASEEKSPSK